MPELQADENEEQRFHLFPPAKKSPARDSLSHSLCCPVLGESARQRARLTTTGSTSQTGAESLPAAARDYVKSIRRSDVVPPREVQPLRRCSCRITRWGLSCALPSAQEPESVRWGQQTL